MRDVSIAPMAVSDGKFSYGENGFSWSGHVRFSLERIQDRVFQTSSAGYNSISRQKSSQASFSDTWAQAQLVLYGYPSVDEWFESHPDCSRVKKSTLIRNLLKDACEDGTLERPTDEILQKESEMAAAYRHHRIKQLKILIARYKKSSEQKKQLEQMLINLEGSNSPVQSVTDRQTNGTEAAEAFETPESSQNQPHGSDLSQSLQPDSSSHTPSKRYNLRSNLSEGGLSTRPLEGEMLDAFSDDEELFFDSGVDGVNSSPQVHHAFNLDAAPANETHHASPNMEDAPPWEQAHLHLTQTDHNNSEQTTNEQKSPGTTRAPAHLHPRQSFSSLSLSQEANKDPEGFMNRHFTSIGDTDEEPCRDPFRTLLPMALHSLSDFSRCRIVGLANELGLFQSRCNVIERDTLVIGWDETMVEASAACLGGIVEVELADD